MSHTYAARRATTGEGIQNQHGLWLDLIWATNEIDPTAFVQPTTGPGETGEYTEEYPRFRVIFHDDETVTVMGKTPADESLLNRAVARMTTEA